MVEEYKRKCNECGKVWHSLVSREKDIKNDIVGNKFTRAAAGCGGHYGTMAQSERNIESQEDLLDKLRRCPTCGSNNYTEKVITYEKK